MSKEPALGYRAIPHAQFCSEEFFYQLGVLQFGDMHRIALDPPPPLRTLVKLAVDAEDTSKSKNSKSSITEVRSCLLTMRNTVLNFLYRPSCRPLWTAARCSLNTSCSRCPRKGLLPGFPTSSKAIRQTSTNCRCFSCVSGPRYALSTPSRQAPLNAWTAPQVNWQSEKACFKMFLRELAYFYVPEPLLPGEVSDTDKANEAALRWQIQHVLFPAMAKYMRPPKSLLDRDVVQVANLPELYRVFERC